MARDYRSKQFSTQHWARLKCFTAGLDIVPVNVEISLGKGKWEVALVFHGITDALEHHSRQFQAFLFSYFLHYYR